MKSYLWDIIESWNFWEQPPKKGIPREVVSEAISFIERPEALYFYGPRRSGKTVVCYQILDYLSKKAGARSCIYFNFEEPAFAGLLNPSLINDAIAEFKRRFKKKPRFIFLDEVQNVPGWERWVRAAVDKKEFKVFVTGSSAKLLSSEFATSLGGRGIGFFVLPFSFKEYRLVYPKGRLEDYFEVGGYPEVVLEKDAKKRIRLLEEYFETAISRDIAARYDVRDVSMLRTLAVYALTNSGKPLSYNKLRAMTGASFDAIRQYLAYLEDAFLVFHVPAFSYSFRKAMAKPRKYYAYDLGLQKVISKLFSLDIGRKAETAVAIELARTKRAIQYCINSFEVDFVVKAGLNLTAINVCYSEKIPAREKKGLEEFKAKNRQTKTLLLGKKELGNWFLKKEL